MSSDQTSADLSSAAATNGGMNGGTGHSVESFSHSQYEEDLKEESASSHHSGYGRQRTGVNGQGKGMDFHDSFAEEEQKQQQQQHKELQVREPTMTYTPLISTSQQETDLSITDPRAKQFMALSSQPRPPPISKRAYTHTAGVEPSLQRPSPLTNRSSTAEGAVRPARSVSPMRHSGHRSSNSHARRSVSPHRAANRGARGLRNKKQENVLDANLMPDSGNSFASDLSGSDQTDDRHGVSKAGLRVAKPSASNQYTKLPTATFQLSGTSGDPRQAQVGAFAGHGPGLRGNKISDVHRSMSPVPPRSRQVRAPSGHGMGRSLSPTPRPSEVGAFAGHGLRKAKTTASASGRSLSPGPRPSEVGAFAGPGLRKAKTVATSSGRSLSPNHRPSDAGSSAGRPSEVSSVAGRPSEISSVAGWRNSELTSMSTLDNSGDSQVGAVPYAGPGLRRKAAVAGDDTTIASTTDLTSRRKAREEAENAKARVGRSLSPVPMPGLRNNRAPSVAVSSLDLAETRPSTVSAISSDDSMNMSSSHTLGVLVKDGYIPSRVTEEHKALPIDEDAVEEEANEKHDGHRSETQDQSRNNEHSERTVEDSSEIMYNENGSPIATKNVRIPPGYDGPGAYSGRPGNEYNRNNSIPSAVLNSSLTGAEDSSRRRGSNDASPRDDDAYQAAVVEKSREFENGDIEQAKEDDRPDNGNEKSSRKRIYWVVGALLALVTIIVVVVVVLISGGNSEDDGETEAAASPDIDGTETISKIEFNATVVPGLLESTITAITNDPTSPQALAFKWMQEDPYLENYPGWQRLQRFSLATFYYSFGGPRWRNSDEQAQNWMDYEVGDECGWFSFENACLADGRVRLLQFNKLSGFGGTMPPEIQFLERLEDLDLTNNIMNVDLEDLMIEELPPSLLLFQCGQCRLQGTIPTTIGLHTNLKALILSENEDLTGTIPSEMGRLTELDSLLMNACRFTGSLPSEIGQMKTLLNVYFHQNSIAGSIPSEVGRLSILQQLELSYNSITGSIPSEIGRLSGLLLLNVASNPELTGTLPTQLGLLRNALQLFFTFNGLTGPIPSEFGRLVGLHRLGLSSNSLGGTLPTQLGGMRALLSLEAERNGLTGTIPSEFGLLQQLTTLNLRQNDLTGTIPEEVRALQKADIQTDL